MSGNTILVARRASCCVANAYSTRLKIKDFKIQTENRQNVQKNHFWQKAPGVNRLNNGFPRLMLFYGARKCYDHHRDCH